MGVFPTHHKQVVLKRVLVGQRSGRLAVVNRQLRSGKISPEDCQLLCAEVQAQYDAGVAYLEEHRELPPGVPLPCTSAVSGVQI